MHVRFFGTYDVRAHPRVAVLQEGFAALGDDVTECNVPLGLDTADRVRILQRPWLAVVLAARVLAAWARLARRARALPKPDVVVVGYMGHFDVHLARWLHRGVPVVLDHMVALGDTALDRGIRRGRLVELLDRVDAAAVGAAEVVVVDTQAHRDHLPESARPRTQVVPVGAPLRWFGPSVPVPAGTSAEPVKVVFFGLYTPLQGAPFIGEALHLLAESGAPVVATMIGDGQDRAECRRLAGGNARVSWVDWVAADDLPTVVAAHDVCLGIFGTGPKARRVVPNKVFQGAAAGCAIVTADTPPQREAFGEDAVYVPPGDPKALAAALSGLARDRDALARLRAAARQRALDAFQPGQVVATLRERMAGWSATAPRRER